MTAGDARKKALEILSGTTGSSAARTGTPSLDISVILSHLLDVDRSYLVGHPETELANAEAAFFEAIERRAEGVPVAYIVGTKEFWGLPFRVTSAVLIPKPDTEILVERAIALLRTTMAPARVLDVCTGSGCIAISIAHDVPSAKITATDISIEALEIARQNARAIFTAPDAEKSAIDFIEGDLRSGLPVTEGKWQLIVSNPPYVPTAAARELLSDGRGEPILALDGGSDGLDLVKALTDGAAENLAANGKILIETGEYNAKGAAAYLKKKGFVDIVIHKDLEGQDRVVEGTLS